MEIKQTDESTMKFEPASDDDSVLVGLMFEKATELFPEWAMGERTDLAMAMFVVVKRWAHNLELTSESHERVVLEPDAL